MKKMKIIGLALGVFALVAAAQPANAACQAPFLITSINADAGYYAYVINPTVTQGPGGDGLQGTSITDQFTGFFWGVGVGDPSPGVGADSGTFAALDWMYVYPNYPVSVLTTWAASAGIDTCIDVQGTLGERCQATFFQDVDTATGAGYFALVSTGDDNASGDFFLDNGGVNITMAPQMAMSILGSVRSPDHTRVAIVLQGPSSDDITPGAYLSDDPACQSPGSGGTLDPLNGLVQGFRAVVQVLPRGSAPPSDFGVDSWEPVSDIVALGSPVEADVLCDGDSDVYASYQLIFDSGFGAPLVSNSTTRVECGPNLAEPGEGLRIKPEGREAPRTRTRSR